MSLKNPVTPPGIDPGTDWLVAQRLNHYVTPGPIYIDIHTHTHGSCIAGFTLRYFIARQGYIRLFVVRTFWSVFIELRHLQCASHAKCRRFFLQKWEVADEYFFTSDGHTVAQKYAVLFLRSQSHFQNGMYSWVSNKSRVILSFKTKILCVNFGEMLNQFVTMLRLHALYKLRGILLQMNFSVRQHNFIFRNNKSICFG
jgi:hypothetical protein